MRTTKNSSVAPPSAKAIYVTVGVLLVLLQTDWSLWLVAYPELHAVTLAIIILIGLYKAPRLSALPALSWLHEPEITKASRTVKKSAQSGQSKGSI